MKAAARPIPGWPGYAATADGHVLSRRTGLPLATRAHWRTGHLRVRLYGVLAPRRVKDVGGCVRGCGRWVDMYVHIAVALAWHGEAPVGCVLVRHLDDDPQNNAPSNLAWGTRSENERDKHRDSIDDDGFDWAVGEEAA